MQSVNEELATVNAELQAKVTDLSRVNNDMNNLLAGTGIATVFVDHRLCILRFTPAASTITTPAIVISRFIISKPPSFMTDFDDPRILVTRLRQGYGGQARRDLGTSGPRDFGTSGLRCNPVASTS